MSEELVLNTEKARAGDVVPKNALNISQTFKKGSGSHKVFLALKQADSPFSAQMIAKMARKKGLRENVVGRTKVVLGWFSRNGICRKYGRGKDATFELMSK